MLIGEATLPLPAIAIERGGGAAAVESAGGFDCAARPLPFCMVAREISLKCFCVWDLSVAILFKCLFGGRD